MNKLDYAYVNEHSISTSLVCPICLDILEDPHTHTACDSAFCQSCLVKLADPICPICRWHWSSTTPIEYNIYLPKTSRLIRNMLDELPVQCLHCRTIRRRGQFEHDCQPTSVSLPSPTKTLESLQLFAAVLIVFLFMLFIYSYPHAVFAKATIRQEKLIRGVAINIDRFLFDKIYYIIVKAVEYSMVVSVFNSLLWFTILFYGDRWTSKGTSELLKKVLETSIIINLITYSIYS